MVTQRARRAIGLLQREIGQRVISANRRAGPSDPRVPAFTHSARDVSNKTRPRPGRHNATHEPEQLRNDASRHCALLGVSRGRRSRGYLESHSRVLDEDARELRVDAFHEALRYDNPTQFLCRTVARPTRLHGQKLEPGQGVMLLYASGNRDEREFDEPDRFDVRRRPARILSFSVGRHLCLGIHVARLETRVALEEILSRHPEYEIDFDRAVAIRTEFIRGFEKLPMQLGSR